MLANVFRRHVTKFVAHNENGHDDKAAPVSPEKVRALATGAALAVELDSSPAVLVNIQHYAQHYRDRGRRTA
jgi:hypothetical protein